MFFLNQQNKLLVFSLFFFMSTPVLSDNTESLDKELITSFLKSKEYPLTKQIKQARFIKTVIDKKLNNPSEKSALEALEKLSTIETNPAIKVRFDKNAIKKINNYTYFLKVFTQRTPSETDLSEYSPIFEKIDAIASYLSNYKNLDEITQFSIDCNNDYINSENVKKLKKLIIDCDSYTDQDYAKTFLDTIQKILKEIIDKNEDFKYLITFPDENFFFKLPSQLLLELNKSTPNNSSVDQVVITESILTYSTLNIPFVNKLLRSYITSYKNNIGYKVLEKYETESQEQQKNQTIIDFCTECTQKVNYLECYTKFSDENKNK